MPFMDLIKNALFEEEPQPRQAARPAGSSASAPASPAERSGSFVPSPSVAPSSSTGDNQFYARLLKQTDFAAVPDLAKIESFAAPLASVIQDKSLRYKAALATAQSQAGLTKQAILNGFDSLVSVLDSSADSFKKQSDEVGRTEVDGRAAQVNDLSAAIEQKQKEIADMQQQVKSKQAEIETSRTKLQRAKSDFAAAYQRRKAEIQQQRKEFEAILQ
jgi:hypothetical protein